MTERPYTTTDAGIPAASDEHSLSVGPDGQVALTGTLDDEYVPGAGWHYGPRVDSVDFELPEAGLHREEGSS